MIQESLRIEASGTFEELYDAYNSSPKPRVIVLIGGSRSGKTWAIMQLLLILGIQDTLRVACWRLKRTWTKPTIWNDFIGLLKNYGLYDKRNSNETELRYTLGSSSIEFGGLDDAQKLHGFKSDIVWINEAIESDKDSFDQLEMRCSGTILLDCNPTEEESWVYDLSKRKDVITLHSTHLNNVFLGELVRKKILSYEPTDINIQAGTADVYKWNVYGLGKAAHKEGLIFTSFNEIDYYPEEAKSVGIGLDFGFYPDPTVAIKVGIYNGKLVLDELIYENDLLNIDLGTGVPSIESRLLDAGVSKFDNITADSAAKSSIAELKGKGFNITACTKGAGSILEGLEIMQHYAPFYVTSRSVNLIKELKNYTRKKDFASGKFLKEPIDAYNHGIDAIRYRLTSYVSTKRAQGVKKASL